MTPDQSLKALLRITGIISGLAVVAVYMPRSWMVFSHQGLGLGPFPEGPITEYLARSASAFYALFGGLLWIVGGDVARYRPIIRYMAIGMLVFGGTLVGVDLYVGLPFWWAALEGLSGLLLSAAMGELLRRGAGKSANQAIGKREAVHSSGLI